MEVKEALNAIDNKNATVKVVDDMVQIKIKQYNIETGLIGEPIKDYISIKELEAMRKSLTTKLERVTRLLSLVNL